VWLAAHPAYAPVGADAAEPIDSGADS
jgi:hypothetical protein